MYFFLLFKLRLINSTLVGNCEETQCTGWYIDSFPSCRGKCLMSPTFKGEKGYSDLHDKGEEVMATRAGSGQSHCIHDQETESRQEVGLYYKLSRPTPSDPFLLARPCSLKVSQLCKAVPPARVQMFKHRSLWGTVRIQTRQKANFPKRHEWELLVDHGCRFHRKLVSACSGVFHLLRV